MPTEKEWIERDSIWHKRVQAGKRWLNRIYGAGQPYKHWQELSRLRDELEPDGKVIIGSWIPSVQIFTPMQADEEFVFLEEFDSWRDGREYGRLMGSVAIRFPKRGCITVIGEVYGKYFIIAKRWNPGPFAKEAFEASKVK